MIDSHILGKAQNEVLSGRLSQLVMILIDSHILSKAQNEVFSRRLSRLAALGISGFNLF